MKQSIYVSLDALLDTRFGTLIRLNEDKAINLIKNGYRDRQSDDWTLIDESIDMSAYQELYDKRDHRTLELSRCSGIVPTLCQMVLELKEASKGVPFIDNITIDLNTYPYDCTDEVKRELANVASYLTGGVADVKISYVPLIGLMPDYLDSNYDAVIMYDFNDWLEKHGGALKEKPLPRLTFIAPAIFHGEIPDDKDLDFGDLNTNDPFTATEMALADFLMLRLVDVSKFSVVEI